jgi:hypothetical protein
MNQCDVVPVTDETYTIGVLNRFKNITAAAYGIRTHFMQH